MKMICLDRSQMRKLDFLHIPGVEKLPEEACAEKNGARIEDIKSLIIVPIAHGGSLIGFLGLDSVHQQKVWTISLLKVVGEISANVLFRKRYGEEDRKVFEEKLIESEERYRTSIENSNDGVAIKRQTSLCKQKIRSDIRV